MYQDPAWVGFLVTVVGVSLILTAWFWVLEKRGLVPQKGSLTLSWTLRRWLGIRPRRRRRYMLVPLFIAACAAIAGGAIWLVVHILVG